MILKGKAHRFEPNDHINTDYIISGRYKFKSENYKEMAQHLMEDISPGFYEKVSPGDFIVAGVNFGCGSSREQAPRVISGAEISAVLAKSFARIFFRNSFNLGLPLVQVNTDSIKAGDELEVDLDKGVVKNLTQGNEIAIKPLPKTVQTILADGGLVPHLKKHGGFALE
jgi:3-isopropylmalate/(R)-2-methylmalate dehydratase small subunit